MTCAVALEGLSAAVRRGDGWVPALEDVSLRVAPREVLGIVGETGAGKTLTIKALTGLLPPGVRPTAGTVSVAGEPARSIVDARASRLLLGRRIGVILQDPQSMFDPLIRIERQLVEGVVTSGAMRPAEARVRAGELLERVGFRDAQEVLRLYPHELSGGMAQRAAIAMALMPSPALIIADEPTSALDATLRVEVLRLLRAAAIEAGAAVLMISHDLPLVGRFCDAVSVMYAGRVVEAGATRAVLDNPRHPYTHRLIQTTATLGSANRAALTAIDGASPQPGTWPDGCSFRPRCPVALDVCAARPALRPVDGRDAACHRAAETRERAALGVER